MTLWTRLKQWYANPFPAELGGGPHRAVRITLDFHLHRDGVVYKSDRKGLRRIENEDVIAMVYERYGELAKQARMQARIHTLKQKIKGT